MLQIRDYPAPNYSSEATDIAAGITSAETSGSAFSYRRTMKRVFDILVVIAMAPVVLPVTLLLALLVARDGGSPFFRQKRLGKGGKVFTILKLRSMVVDADAAMERHLAANPAAKAEWDATQKLKNDPRITRIGRLLRKTSLDELPQLWNVFRGDMSLVGPRPMMVDQRSLYPGTAYFNLRPGITGSWQVSERNESEFRVRATYDAVYDRDISLRTDLGILMRTVGVVLRATGV